MERRRLERAAAEKARVEAAAATAELEALAVQEAAARERARAVEVAAVRTLRENLERRATPWRESRARRTKGVTWTTTPKPIFVSYAPTPDATFVELAYCKKIAAILDDVRTIAPPGESKGERVRLAWLDASELGTLVTSTDERALARLEACESCAGVVAIVTPAYLASEQCAVERDAVRIRRASGIVGGEGDEVPVVAIVVQPPPPRSGEDKREGGDDDEGDGDASPAVSSFDPTAIEGLLGAGDPPPIVVPNVYDPVIAAEAALTALESLRGRGAQLRECLGGAAHPGFDPATKTFDAATLTALTERPPPDERDVKAWMDANGGSWRRRPFLEWTKHETHAFLLSHGTYLKPYADAMLDFGVDGFLLASIEDEDLRVTFAVANRNHRRGILTHLAALCGKRPPVNEEALARHETLMRRRVGIQTPADPEERKRTQTATRPILQKYLTDAPPSPTRATIVEGTAARLARMSDEQLRDFCAEIFIRATDDFDGFLNRAEFKRILKGADLGFSARDVREIMAEVDQKTWENADGLIDWHEFEPVAMRLMRTIGCTVAARAREDLLGSTSSPPHLDTLPDTSRRSRPMNETGVQYTLSRVFHDAIGDDGTGTGGGALTKDQFARTLRTANLGLAKTEIDALWSKNANKNALAGNRTRDGSIAYREFEPIAREVMTRRLEGEYATASMYAAGDELLKLVLTAFDAVSGGEARVPVVGDAPGGVNRAVNGAVNRAVNAAASRGVVAGSNPVGSIRDAMLVNLRDYGVPVTNLHAAVVCAEACRVASPVGTVDWRAFAPAAADCLRGMLDAAEAERRDVAVATFAATEGAKVIAELRHRDRSTLRALLAEAFTAADEDESGALDRDELQNVLLALARRKEVTPPMRAAMSMSMRCVDVDGDGAVKYGELVDFFCDVAGHMERGARVRAALDASERRAAARRAGDVRRAKALEAEKARDAEEVARADRALKMATLRAECAKYLSALTSDNAYALYRDAVDIVARFSGQKSDVSYSGNGSGNGSGNVAGQKSDVSSPPFDVHAVELRRGTETRIGTVAPRSQVLRVVVSTCASAVNATLRRGEGVSWPAAGYPKVDDDENGSNKNGSNENGSNENGSNGNGGVGVAVDVPELAASHGAVSLASSAVDEARAPGEAGSGRPAASGPGGYFACPFRGGATRGYIAVDTVGEKFADGRRISDDDKEIVRIVAQCVGDALEEGFRAREGEREEKRRAALERFDGEEERKRREEEFLARYRGK